MEILTWLGMGCDLIILIGALVLAFDRMIKPIGFLKKKTDKKFDAKVAAILKEVLPEILLEHDKGTREKYKSDREKYLQDIKGEVLGSIKSELTQVELLKQQYEVLVLSAKDVLRAKIMTIYEDNKRTRTIPLSKKEALEQYYKDYKELKGNSYIDKYYNRMSLWKVVDDEDEVE